MLDGGYLKLIESWGSDERIIESARLSTGRGFVSWDPYRRCKCDLIYFDPVEKCNTCGRTDFENFPHGDLGLLRRLWNKRHLTPFECAGCTLEIQAPIMVAREWFRHRTFSYNEISARYAPIPDNNYIPSVDRLMDISTTNRQAAALDGAIPLTEPNAEAFRAKLAALYAHGEQVYQWALLNGVAKELARLGMPVGRFTRFRVSGNLRNWFQFLDLREPNDAQYEIRVYAHAVRDVIREVFPRVYSVARPT